MIHFNTTATTTAMEINSNVGLVQVYHTKVLLYKGIIDKGIIHTKVLLDKGIVRN